MFTASWLSEYKVLVSAVGRTSVVNEYKSVKV